MTQKFKSNSVLGKVLSMFFMLSNGFQFGSFLNSTMSLFWVMAYNIPINLLIQLIIQRDQKFNWKLANNTILGVCFLAYFGLCFLILPPQSSINHKFLDVPISIAFVSLALTYGLFGFKTIEKVSLDNTSVGLTELARQNVGQR